MASSAVDEAVLNKVLYCLWWDNQPLFLVIWPATGGVPIESWPALVQEDEELPKSKVRWPFAVLDMKSFWRAAVPSELTDSCSGARRTSASRCYSELTCSRFSVSSESCSGVWMAIASSWFFWANLQLFWSMGELQPEAGPCELACSCSGALKHEEILPAADLCKLTCRCSGAWRATASSRNLWADFQLFWSMQSYSQTLFLVDWPSAVLEHGELQPEAKLVLVGWSQLFWSKESYSQKMFLGSWPLAVLEHGELQPPPVPSGLTCSCSGTWRATANSCSSRADLQLFCIMESYCQQLFPIRLACSCSGEWRVNARSWSL